MRCCRCGQSVELPFDPAPYAEVTAEIFGETPEKITAAWMCLECVAPYLPPAAVEAIRRRLAADWAAVVN